MININGYTIGLRLIAGIAGLLLVLFLVRFFAGGGA